MLILRCSTPRSIEWCRVHAANIRLHLNAWHTNSRYKKKMLTSCYFCARQVQDSLEHIFHCHVVQSVFPRGWRGDVAKCLFLSSHTEDDILLASILVYGLYAFHCSARHSETPRHSELKGSILRLIGKVSFDMRLSNLWRERLWSIGWR